MHTDSQTTAAFTKGKKKYLCKMLIITNSILESARRDGYIKENPAADKRIVIPSKKKTVRRALELDIKKNVLCIVRNITHPRGSALPLQSSPRDLLML